MFKYCAIAALIVSATAQTISDAYAKITSDTGQLAGGQATYEFTVEILSGVTIKTYLPPELTNQDKLTVCT